MIEHDAHVGKILKALDDAGIADNTIVLYTTDNGPHKNSWPGRRHFAVPQREGHQLGRRLSRAVRDPLAGPYQAGVDRQRDSQRPRLAAHAARLPRATPT
jgi:arylsulfatase A-like enzyme